MKVEPYSSAFDRDLFDCGVPPLNAYIKRFAGQDVRRNLASCFVVPDSDGRLIAYYTLSAASITLDSLPENIARKLSYSHIPAVLLGRLAVDRSQQGKGMAKALLANAIERVRRLDIGCFALLVNAKDHHARSFYAQYGFHEATDSQLTLFYVL